jgi:hypothetical protein
MRIMGDGNEMADKFTPWSVAAAVSLVVPATAMIVWPDARWPELLLAGWAVAAALVLVEAERRANRRRIGRLLEQQQQFSLRLLSQNRHDWMNDLQILYGYLRLQKYHKAIEAVDRIRERMERESRVARLGSARLSSFLLSFRVLSDTLRLEVQVDDDVALDGPEVWRDRLAKAVMDLVNAVRFRVVRGSNREHTLYLTFARGDRGIELRLRFAGEVTAVEELREEWQNALGGIGRLAEFRLAEETDENANDRLCAVVAFPARDAME